jgi:pilus assembly protein CpaF
MRHKAPTRRRRPNRELERSIEPAYRPRVRKTSYAAQGATVDRVLVHIDTSDSRNRALINQTLGYVAISRPRYDAQIYTDSKERIAYALSRLRMNTTALAPEQIAAYKERAEQMAVGDLSLDLILPFLEQLGVFIKRTDVSELMINADGRVFVQIGGGTEQVRIDPLPKDKLEQAVKRIARSIEEEIGPDPPLLDATLSDGSRVAAAYGMLSEQAARILTEAVEQRKTILVSGGAGSRKTTLVKAPIDQIPQSERLGIIEDTAELKIDHPNVFRFVARRGQRDGDGNTIPAITVRDLVRAALRHRPSRIIIAEVRGAEAFDLIDAVNTGHPGSISTLHANSGSQALNRLASLAMRADVGISHSAIRQDISDLIDIVVQVKHDATGQRRVESIDGVIALDVRPKGSKRFGF